jgi:hypothetical protein
MVISKDDINAMFSSRRALQAITFHKRDGVVLRAIDPIERGCDG